jgi:hypothetical protein
MPKESQEQSRFISDLALPYASFVSPIDETPHIAEGYNVLTSMRRVVERRPGFATPLETQTTPTIFAPPNRVVDIFTWRRWTGSNFVMLAVINATQSIVYKLEIGKDKSLVELIRINNSTVPFSFVFQNNFCLMGNGTDGSMWKYDGTNFWKWGIDKPTKQPITNLVAVAKGITVQTDVHYCFTYWNAVTGGESGPSDLNDCLGQFTNMGVGVSVFKSPDPQVTHIRIYRSRDGGSTNPPQMQELPISPIVNADATVTDYTNDADLRNNFGPGLNTNDPPPPLRGLKTLASRIFGISGNQVWYSGFDEIVNGMQEECFPSGVGGNYFPFNDKITMLGTIAGDNAGIIVQMPSSIWMIQGELRSQINRYMVEDLYGSRTNPYANASWGGDFAWFDISKQIRTAKQGEISVDIRPDVEAIDPVWVGLKVHIAGKRKWLCVLDSITGKLYVLDLDTNRWQVPWPIGATAIHSGEIAPGQRVLFAAIGGQIWYMTEGKFNDAGKAYPARLTTSLIPLAGTAASLVSSLHPNYAQALDGIIIQRDTHDMKDVLISLNEKAGYDAGYKSLKRYETDPEKVKQSDTIVAKRYPTPNELGLATKCSVRIEWDAVDAPFELYSVDTELHPSES